jgi:hypothetical protein
MPQFLSEKWFRHAAARIEESDDFGRVADGFEATMVFGTDDDQVAAAFADGEMSVLGDPTYEAWDIALRAPTATWRKLLAETPPPRHHDLIGAWLQADLTIEGDLQLAIRHLRPLKRLLEVFREVAA